MPKSQEYKALAVWHKETGSMPYYIQQEQEKAAKDNAPLNAIYYSMSQEAWMTTDDLPKDHWILKKIEEAKP